MKTLNRAKAFTACLAFFACAAGAGGGEPVDLEGSSLSLAKSPAAEFKLFHPSRVQRLREIQRENNKQFFLYIYAKRIFRNISPDQVRAVLNSSSYILFEKPPPPIFEGDMEKLYQNGGRDDVLEFIDSYNLSAKQALLVLYPFLKEGELVKTPSFKNRLSDEDIIFILKELGLSLNTELTIGDLISLYVFRAGVFLNPDTVISSLGHILSERQSPKLMEFLYSHKDFDPNKRDIMGQTHLHSLFFQEDRLFIGGWKRIFEAAESRSDIDFNARDILGLSPAALAIRNGFKKALVLFFEIEAVDKHIRDSYGRDLALTAAKFDSSKDKELTRWIISKTGGDSIRPSGFNEILTRDFELVLAQAPHPLAEAAKAIARLERQKPGGADSEMLKELDRRSKEIKKSQLLRLGFIQNAGSRVPFNDFERLVWKAIEEDDKSFFIDNARQPSLYSFLESISYAMQIKLEEEPSGKSSIYISVLQFYNVLLHAIYQTAPQAVEWILGALDNEYILRPPLEAPREYVEAYIEEQIQRRPDWNFQLIEAYKAGNIEGRSFYMDPLSEAMAAHFLIERKYREDERFSKEKSEKILNLLLDSADPNLKTFIGLRVIDIAALLGFTDIVKYFHEAKGAPLPVTFWSASASPAEIVRVLGHQETADYLSRNGAGCAGAFH